MSDGALLLACADLARSGPTGKVIEHAATKHIADLPPEARCIGKETLRDSVLETGKFVLSRVFSRG